MSDSMKRKKKKSRRAANTTSMGLMGLIFWLVVGFGFTEFTAVALNAWFLNAPHGQQQMETVAAIQAGAHD